jgi:N-acetylmuramoyl-L-alanine amidase
MDAAKVTPRGTRIVLRIGGFLLAAATVGVGAAWLALLALEPTPGQAPLGLAAAMPELTLLGAPGGHAHDTAGEGASTVPDEPAPPRLERPAGSLLVVLDAGHGGSNTGAPAAVEGVYEKRFTLILAQMVAERLRRVPGVIVIMTREDDRYLTLRARTRLANALGADVFVSVHANASTSRAQRGFETWVLSPEALTVDSRAIRAGDGPTRPDVPAYVAAVLDDVERGAAQGEALALAAAMQRHLGEVWGTARSRGVRQGAQDVLMGLTMPGVLVEVGFIDHPEEGAALLAHDTRERLADALTQAILDRRPAVTAQR